MTPPSSADYDFAAAFESAGIADWATRGGDPAAGVAAILEALALEDPPLHFVVGDAGVDAVLHRTRQRLAEHERWEDLGRLP